MTSRGSAERPRFVGGSGGSRPTGEKAKDRRGTLAAALGLHAALPRQADAGCRIGGFRHLAGFGGTGAAGAGD